jgi:hypothetical protein
MNALRVVVDPSMKRLCRSMQKYFILHFIEPLGLQKGFPIEKKRVQLCQVKSY